MVKLKVFHKFDNTSEALEAVTKLVEGTPSKGLHKYLKNNCDDGEILAVADPKLGDIITEKLVCVFCYDLFIYFCIWLVSYVTDLLLSSRT